MRNEILANYSFRSFPCNYISEGQLWAVSGQYKGQSGVLEWCLGETDAMRMLNYMRMFPGMTGLRAHKWAP